MKNTKLLLLSGLAFAVFAGAVLAQSPGVAIVNETGHGTIIGNNPSAGFSGWGAYPIVQRPVGTDPYRALQAFGLIASGTAPYAYPVQSGTGLTALAVFPLKTGTASPIGSATVAAPGTLFLLSTGTSAAIYLKLSGTGSTGWGLITTGTGP